jgi:chromate transporter
MLALGLGADLVTGSTAATILHALKIVAAAVIAQAVWGMARTLTPDLTRAAIGGAALTFALLVGGPYAQVAAIALGAIAGALFCKGTGGASSAAALFPVSRRAGLLSIGLAVAIFVALPLAARLLDAGRLSEFDAFYRSGALVFGGGHVVLPLLRSAVVDPGWVSADTFLAGYGMAQALPGPLFTFAAYLGAAMAGPGYGLVGGVTALIALFLPGVLLVYGALPFAGALRTNALAGTAMQGANAAVVGILAAALYDPVLLASVFTPADALMAVAGFVLLAFVRLPSWAVVLLVPCCVLALSALGVPL